MKKKFRFYILGMSMAFGCASSATQQETKNLALVQQMYAAFNSHDWQKMSAFYADSALFLDPSFGTAYIRQSRANIVNKYAELEKLFPTIHDEVITLVAKDDKVFVEFVATGNSGDSIQLTLPIAGVLTLKNNLIVKDATYYNNCQ